MSPHQDGRPRRRRSLAALGYYAGALLAMLGAPAHATTAVAPACDYLARSVTAQPAGALLLASYPSERSGALSNAAFTYDS